MMKHDHLDIIELGRDEHKELFFGFYCIVALPSGNSTKIQISEEDFNRLKVR